jgi:hypothetical protein
MTMIMTKNQSSKSQVHVTAFQGTEVKRPKVGLNRRPIAYTAGGEGGLVLIQHLYSRGKETDVQQDTCKGYQANLAHC